MRRFPRSLAAISIRQPWASLIAMSAIDHYQVPSETEHRGLVAVHATGRDSYVSAAAAWNDLVANVSLGRTPLRFPLPQTAVIAVADLVDCVHSDSGWELRLADVRRASTPIASPGQIGVWSWRLPSCARRWDFWRAV